MLLVLFVFQKLGRTGIPANALGTAAGWLAAWFVMSDVKKVRNKGS